MSETTSIPAGTTVINLTITGELSFSFDRLTIINNFAPKPRNHSTVPSDTPQTEQSNPVPVEVTGGDKVQEDQAEGQGSLEPDNDDDKGSSSSDENMDDQADNLSLGGRCDGRHDLACGQFDCFRTFATPEDRSRHEHIEHSICDGYCFAKGSPEL